MTPDAERRIREFISCLSALKTLGWNTWTVFSHAFHESGGFEASSEGRRRMLDAFNYWGIKLRKSWAGPRVEVITHEWVKHQPNPEIYKQDPMFISVVENDVAGRDKVKVKAYFMGFTSCASALLWYDEFIGTSKNYKDAYLHKLDDDPQEFFAHLVDKDEPGELEYATDPNYVGKNIACHNYLKSDEKIKSLMAQGGFAA